MKLLVDESLQHELARILSKAGHDAVHVTDLDLNGAPDDDVLELVAEQLIRGSVITVDGSRLRIRELPIRPES